MWKAGLAVFLVAGLAGCANENGAIPLDRETWSPNTNARGTPYSGAQRASAPASAPASQRAAAAEALFREFCTPYPNNTARISAVEVSGRFGASRLSALPVPQFSDVVFFVYTDRASGAQIGFGNRRADQYCVAVDGTPEGDELWVLGPED